MPLVFFHLQSGEDRLLDREGIEVPPDRFADRALMEARALIADDAGTGRLDLRDRIDVADSSGTVLHRLVFADAIEVIMPADSATG